MKLRNEPKMVSRCSRKMYTNDARGKNVYRTWVLFLFLGAPSAKR